MENLLVIETVNSGGVAEQAGLRYGDVLVEYNGTPIAGDRDILLSAIERDASANHLSITVVRDGTVMEVRARPGPLGIAVLSKTSAGRASTKEDLAIAKIVLTTTHSVPNRKIGSVLKVVSAECAFGMNLFRDLFAAVTDVFGGRSSATQKVLRDARETCLWELRKEASFCGADAVVAVHLAYSEFSGKEKSMLFLVATGTAVKLEEE